MNAEPWHTESIDEVCAQLQTSTAGLSEAEATARQTRFGKNVLSREKKYELLRFLLRHLNDPLYYVLFASGLLAMAMQKFIDGCVVLSVIVLNTLIGIFQEFRANRAIQALMQMIPEHCLAMRGGVKRQIDVRDLVPGDVVFLSAGERVGADIRLFTAAGLKTDESPLTGESVPAVKETGTVTDPSSIGDRFNMVYSGTLVVSGQGQGIVVATGSNTALGSITHLVDTATEVKTPLVERLTRLSYWLTGPHLYRRSAPFWLCLAARLLYGRRSPCCDFSRRWSDP